MSQEYFEKDLAGGASPKKKLAEDLIVAYFDLVEALDLLERFGDTRLIYPASESLSPFSEAMRRRARISIDEVIQLNLALVSLASDSDETEYYHSNVGYLRSVRQLI